MRLLDRAGLAQLFDALHATGRQVIGPTKQGGAIRLGPVESAAELPQGFTDAQGPGQYRLHKQGDALFNGYVVGPDSLKAWFFPSREVLYTAERRPDGKLGFSPTQPPPERLAFLGVRACDLAAAGVQDRAMQGGPFTEPRYAERRDKAILIAIHCTKPGDLCFCASTGTGPRVTDGADLVLAERESEFLVEAHTEDGEALLAQLDTTPASDDDARWLDEAMQTAAGNMGREVDTKALPERLFARLDHPRFAAVAERCLSCGNCTNVCPTCFCSTTEDPSGLDGQAAQKVRLWDSCFTEDHAYIHGGTFRPSTEDRYRQWLTHKVGSWVSQFGTSGCVGCGRCIAFCPVGIDLTEEIAALGHGQAEAAVELPAAPAYARHQDDNLVPHPADVLAVTRETDDVVTLRLKTARIQHVKPGQFNQVSLPGIGEVPISVSAEQPGELSHTIRAVGATTRALCALVPGQQVGLRGPYGRPWPLDELAGRPVLLIAGGIGMAPLRNAIVAMLDRPADFPQITLLYGSRNPDEILYLEDFAAWRSDPRFSLHLTVDHATPAWREHVGVVTRLLDRDSVPPNAAAMMCGPEIMMRFTVDALSNLGIPDERIFLTMERHMECATGFCGRCQYGPYFVCKDGPVFSFDQIRFLFGQKGF